jgi:hypothetical protein
MGWRYFDRVAETSTTTGTGSFTVAGAVTGFQAFDDVFSVGETFYYLIEAVDADGVPTGDWESGLATYSGTNTIARTVVTDSSTGGSTISFAAGTKRVHCAVTAAALKPKIGKVYRSTTLSALNASVSFTNVTWDNYVYDTHTFWDSSTKLIMPAGQWDSAMVQLKSQLHIQNLTAAEQIEAKFYVDGSAFDTAGYAGHAIDVANSTTRILHLDSGIMRGDASSEFQVRVKTASDSSIDITTLSWFELAVVGPVLP